MFRSAIRSLFPYPVIETARRIIYAGVSRKCYLCKAHVRRFLPQGYEYPVLERLQVVGGMYKADDRCPVCHGTDRDRLVKFYLEHHVFNSPVATAKVLHIAPEKGLTKYLSSLPVIQYLSADLDPSRYRHVRMCHEANLLALPFEDGSIKVVVCNHVLEHIVDDGAAMKEIQRVLSPDGVAILQVPISLKLDRTIEGDGSEPEPEKIRLYGQRDHVRIYTESDYIRRLGAAGLEVERYSAFDDDEVAARKLRLNPLEILYVCRPRLPAA